MNVAILDDHRLLVDALTQAVLTHQPEAQVTGCTRWDELEQALMRDSFDLVLMDMRLSECLGVELLPQIHEMAPAARVVLVSAFTSQELLLKSLNLGIAGYLSKTGPMESFQRGLAAVLRGERHFDSPMT